MVMSAMVHHIGLYPVYKRPDISVIFVCKRHLLTV